MTTATITTFDGTVIVISEIQAGAAFGADWDEKGIQWSIQLPSDDSPRGTYTTNPAGEGLFFMADDGPHQKLGNGQFNAHGRTFKARVRKLARRLAKIHISQHELDRGHTIDIID